MDSTMDIIEIRSKTQNRNPDGRTMDIIEIRSKTQNHIPDGQYNGYY